MRVAIVVPRYGADVVGGAERLARGLAEALMTSGYRVEIWTTCAQSHYTWENEYPPGPTSLNGVLVRRFPVVPPDEGRRAALETRLGATGMLTPDEQFAWLEYGAHSPHLYHHVSEQARAFDVVAVMPYAAPLAHYAAWAAPDRSVLFPCLHHEPYAFLAPVRLLIERAWGVVFNTPEERDFAIRYLQMQPRRQAVLGIGVSSVASAARTPSERDLVYVGRLEEGKNLPLLYSYVRRYAADNPGRLRLVVVGTGPYTPPDHPAFEYRGFVSEAEKAQVCGSALALCQPSLNESFSITIMESWLNGRPVLVHRDCYVTRAHVERSSGGLWFATYEEFASAVEWLRAHDGLARRMGENGRRYVEQNYRWDAVASRFVRLIRCWRQHG